MDFLRRLTGVEEAVVSACAPPDEGFETGVVFIDTQEGGDIGTARARCSTAASVAVGTASMDSKSTQCSVSPAPGTAPLSTAVETVPTSTTSTPEVRRTGQLKEGDQNDGRAQIDRGNARGAASRINAAIRRCNVAMDIDVAIGAPTAAQSSVKNGKPADAPRIAPAVRIGTAGQTLHAPASSNGFDAPGSSSGFDSTGLNNGFDAPAPSKGGESVGTGAPALPADTIDPVSRRIWDKAGELSVKRADGPKPTASKRADGGDVVVKAEELSTPETVEWCLDGLTVRMQAATIEREYLTSVEAHENVVRKIRYRELLVARSLSAPRGDIHRRQSGIADGEKAIEVAKDVHGKLLQPLLRHCPVLRAWINDGLLQAAPGHAVWVNVTPPPVAADNSYVLRRMTVRACCLSVCGPPGGTIVLSTGAETACLPIAPTQALRWFLSAQGACSGGGGGGPLPRLIPSPCGDQREKHLIQILALPHSVVFLH